MGLLIALSVGFITWLLTANQLSAFVHDRTEAHLVADGAQTPDAIPDDKAYSMLFLVSSAGSGASDVAKQRAQAVVSSFGLTSIDRTNFVEVVQGYRAALDQLDKETEQAQAGSPDDQNLFQDIYDRRQAALHMAIRDVEARLSVLGTEKFSVHKQHAKRSIQLYAIPSMESHVASNLLQHLLAIFSPTVHAQGMSPSGTVYTNLSIDPSGNGKVYSTAITDATSSCACHQSTASTYVTYGNIGGNPVSASGRERVEADGWTGIDDDQFADGAVLAGHSTHTSYCPKAGITFIQRNTGGSATSKFINAYYYCEWNSSSNACASNLGIRTYHRCNPGACDPMITSRIKGGSPFPKFALLNVLFIDLPGQPEECIAGSTIIPTDKCHSPDPKP